MNKEQRKQIKLEYAQQKPVMGILRVRHHASGDSFLLAVRNAKAARNSGTMQLERGNHPDKELQALWTREGAGAFTVEIDPVLPYDKKDPEKTDYSEELLSLLEKTLSEIPGSRIIYIPGRKGLK